MSQLAVALAPDPAVPQRDHLLDLDAMAQRLSSRLGHNGRLLSIRSCHAGCISYRAGKRLRVVYRIHIDGRVHHVAASTFHSSSRAERAYRAAATNAWHAGPLRPVVLDVSLDSVFWTYPNDRRIENLRAVAGAQYDVTQLIEGPWTKSRLVDYYPEESAVMRCLSDRNRTIAYAKVRAGDQGERTGELQAAWAELAHGTDLQIARPLSYSEHYRTLLVEPIVGTSLGRLQGRDLLAGLYAYGAALATLHSLPCVDVGKAGRDALGRLKHKAESVRVVRPDVAAAVLELLEQLSTRWEEAAGEPVAIHGDTNENNAILQRDRVALIDFDRASIGAAGSDIGNFLGLLRYFRSLGLISPAVARARASAFLRGYASVRALPDQSSLRVHESAAVAERAFRAITRVRRASLERIPALLTEARKLLN